MRKREILFCLLTVTATIDIFLLIVFGYFGIPEGFLRGEFTHALLSTVLAVPCLSVMAFLGVIGGSPDAEAPGESEAKGEAAAIADTDKEELAGRLLSLMNNVPGAVYRGLKDWSVVFIGAEVERMTGYTAEEFLSGAVRWKSLIHPEDLENVRATFREAVGNREKILRVEYRALHRDGEYRWIADRRQLVYDEEGRFLYVDGLLIDVTGRKARQDELRETHRRLDFHVAMMPLGYIVWDGDSRVAEWNPTAEKIFGWTADEARGRNASAFNAPPAAGADREVLAHVRKDGQPIICEWFNATLRGAGGEIVGRLSMVNDITERKRLEKQLQTAQRMESVGTLAGGIAHDFNNALTGILGFAELLRRRLEGNEGALSDLDQIEHCTERASRLTRQLMTYARRQIIQPVTLDLNAVVADLMKLIRKGIGEHIEFGVRFKENLPAIFADCGQVEQVLMNLCLNSRDAMPSGGSLLIETRDVTFDAEDLDGNAYMRPGRYAVLIVSDTGVGMDPETRERVFDPFFTTKEPGKGTGLGLAMVYGIVKQHNGFINLYSEPGRGTTFKIYFPATDAVPAPAPEKKREPIRGGTETILVAEDEEPLRGLAERTLGDLGYEVLIARDGREAVERFRECGRISLVLLDVVMPREGGKETYAELVRERPGLKVIFMSGYSADTIHDAYVLDGGIHFLQKPFSPGALARKVREVLDAS